MEHFANSNPDQTKSTLKLFVKPFSKTIPDKVLAIILPLLNELGTEIPPIPLPPTHNQLSLPPPTTNLPPLLFGSLVSHDGWWLVLTGLSQDIPQSTNRRRGTLATMGLLHCHWCWVIFRSINQQKRV